MKTEIRRLKKRVKDLETLCMFFGISYYLIKLPELVTNIQKPTEKDIKWVKEKIKEYKKLKS